MRPRLPWMVLFWLAAASCGTVRHWRELQSGPATQADVYNAVEFLARSDGFAPQPRDCDRGLGTWQSSWRYRQIGLGRPGRYRLIAEILLDRGSDAEGWIVRYVIEQQSVKDLGRSLEPREEDWSDGGQDVEKEYLFGRRLMMRLGTGGTTGREPMDPQGGGR